MKTYNEEARKLVLSVSCKNSRIEKTCELSHLGGSSSRKEDKMQVQEEITADQDSYKDKAEKDEVCRATSLLDLEAKDDETARGSRPQNRNTSVGNWIMDSIRGRKLHSLDNLKTEMNLLEKEMDCAETSWTKEEEGETDLSYECTNEENIDDDEVKELMEDCTGEEMNDVFGGID